MIFFSFYAVEKVTIDVQVERKLKSGGVTTRKEVVTFLSDLNSAPSLQPLVKHIQVVNDQHTGAYIGHYITEEIPIFGGSFTTESTVWAHKTKPSEYVVHTHVQGLGIAKYLFDADQSFVVEQEKNGEIKVIDHFEMRCVRAMAIFVKNTAQGAHEALLDNLVEYFEKNSINNQQQ